MSTERNFTYTTTGAKDALDINPGDTVMVGITSGASDATDIEVKLNSTSNTWHKVLTGASNNITKVIDGGVIAIRVNITANVSTSIAVDYLIARRA